MGVTYNHFVTVSDRAHFDVEVDKQSMMSTPGLSSHLVNGYEGFSGAHDNLIWSIQTGSIIYTLNNKLIVENTKSRE